MRGYCKNVDGQKVCIFLITFLSFREELFCIGFSLKPTPPPKRTIVNYYFYFEISQAAAPG